MPILIICRNNSLPAQGVVLRKKKKSARKILIFRCMPFAKMKSAGKNCNRKYFFAPAPGKYMSGTKMNETTPPPPPPEGDPNAKNNNNNQK